LFAGRLLDDEDLKIDRSKCYKSISFSSGKLPNEKRRKDNKLTISKL
jgi:hypothetical protein